MAYFDTKSGSLEEAIRQAVGGQINEAKVVMDLENDDPKLMKDIKGFGLKVKDLGDSGNKGYNEYEISGPQSKIDAASKKLNLQASYHEKLDPVNKSAAKKKFDDRQDKDIDNDGDVDSSDKFLHKRRKAVSKAIKSDKKENYELGTPENTKAKLDATPGQSSDDWNKQVETIQKKNMSMREAIAKMWGVEEGHNPFKEGKQSNPDNFEPFKKKGKKEDKTMTGKPMTKVDVDPDMKEKKTDK